MAKENEDRSTAEDRFKRITTRYPFTCSGGCGQRYPQGTIAYWKQDVDQNGVHHSFLVCERCWKLKNNI